MASPEQVELAIVGAGGAGSCLLLAIDAAVTAGRLPAPRIALIDPEVKAENDRTWCWWAPPSDRSDPIAPLLAHTWESMQLIGPDGAARTYPLTPDRYVMLRSADLYRAADDALRRLGGLRVTRPCTELGDDGDGVRLVAGDVRLDARWAYDSRPAPPRRPGGTFFLQHFRGWTVRLAAPVLPVEPATLMDFRVPQPPVGVAFAYCLPLALDRALVEYTEFSPARLDSPGYDQALRGYLHRRWPTVQYTVQEVEDGAIPMTDAPFARRAGARVFRLGTAGGATRPSTGYTFAAMQRQAAGVVAAMVAGRPPVPPRPYPLRHRWMDAVLLRAIRDGRLDPPELFTSLFAANPTDRVIRFLDGVSSPAEELAVMRSAPMMPMLRAGAGDALSRMVRLLLRSVATHD